MAIEVYLYAFGSVLIVSIVSLVGVFTLSIREASLRKALAFLVSLAAGALIGDAFLHLIPEGIEKIGGTPSGLFVIGGFLLFFIIEKIFHWHHYHNKMECEEAADHHKLKAHAKKINVIRPTGYLVLISDGFHNFLDGIIIGVSYLAGIEIGLATTIAVILHEIPQEIGDFGVLLHAGFSRCRALFLNFLSALLAFLGVLAAFAFSKTGIGPAGWLIPLSAGGFIYIAAADLVPELHKTRSGGTSALQFLVMLAGIAAMFALLFVS